MPVDTTYLRIDEVALAVERRQAWAEGRALGDLDPSFEAVRDRVTADPAGERDAARGLFERIQDLPCRGDYEYVEPSSLAEIRAARPDGPRQLPVEGGDHGRQGVESGGEAESGTAGQPEAEHIDGVLGAWLGRCAGCLLGKPVEGWTADRLHGFLRATGNHPIRAYIESDIPADVWAEYDLDDVREEQLAFADEIDHMVRDDDIDYTVAGLALVSRHGLDYDAEDVAEFWLRNLPALQTYTAERVAYRNLLETRLPPESARYCNPYREGIGAQIRADVYGYVCPGDPERAAALAWRDARVSHVKNGIYGAMWVAAMLAAAPAVEDRETVVRVGLSEVPAESRFAAAIHDVLRWAEGGRSAAAAIDRVHDRWDETTEYGWLHVIPNAQIVTIGLLWGDGFAEAVGTAVQAAFDTDCNGATVGSVVGRMAGASSIPDRFVAPLGETVETSLVETPRADIRDLARRTARLTAAPR